MSFRKLVIAGALGVSLSGLLSLGPVAAQTASASCPPGATAAYPPGQCQAQVSDTTVSPGQKIRFRATGYKPHSEVRIELHSTPIALLTVNADALGAVDVEITLPAGVTPGAHELVASGIDPSGAPRVVAAKIVVPGQKLGRLHRHKHIHKTCTHRRLHKHADGKRHVHRIKHRNCRHFHVHRHAA